MVDWALLVVKFVHVLSAMAWLGLSGIFGFLIDAGSAAAWSLKQVRRWIAIAAGSTILFGLETARREFGSLNPLAWPQIAPAEGGLILTGLFLAVGAFGVQQWRLRVAKDLGELRLMFRVVAGLLTFTLFLMIATGLGGF